MKNLPKMPRGMGSFQQRGDSFRYEKTHTYPDGFTKIRIGVTAKTIDECINFMKVREKELDKEFLSETIPITQDLLQDAMKKWLKEEKLGKIKATSYDRIERTIKNQIEDTRLGIMPAADVDADDIRSHLDYLRYDKKYSQSVISKTYDVLHQFFHFLYAKDLSGNPMNGIAKPTKGADIGELVEERNLFESNDLKDMVLSDDEIKTFRDWVFNEAATGSQGRSKYGLALYFTMMTFLRSGEARTLRWRDLDLDHNRLQVTKSISRVINRSEEEDAKTQVVTTTPKTANGVRIVMITDDAKEAILEHKKRMRPESENELIFATDNGKPLSEAQAWRALNGILYATNLKKDPKKEYKDQPVPPARKGFSMHYLRHTGISYYLRHGVPIDVISRMAGHSSTDVTRRVYYHIIADQTEDAFKIMNGI